MKKISTVCVLGTRPEAIKMAPIVKELKNRPDRFATTVLATGQHREMLDQVLMLFGIKPDHDLDIMAHGQDLFDITTRTLSGIKQVFVSEKPDLVIVQGDTTTTFAAALAGFYVKACVAHVESGLRTYDKYHPYPEEMNRRMTTAVTDLHFAPTETAKNNLLAENIPGDKIFVTGNTVIDAMLSIADRDYVFTDNILSRVDFSKRRMVLVTAHRRENWGEPMNGICRAVKELVDRFDDIEVVFSMHLNPLVRTTVENILGGLDRVRLITPLDYEPFIQLMNKAYLILSDSGGVQEEAPSLGTPVLVLREVTERPEGIEAGTARLVGHDFDIIVETAGRLLEDEAEYDKMAKAHNPYGDGHAAKRIIDILDEQLGPRR